MAQKAESIPRFCWQAAYIELFKERLTPLREKITQRVWKADTKYRKFSYLELQTTATDYYKQFSLFVIVLLCELARQNNSSKTYIGFNVHQRQALQDLDTALSRIPRAIPYEVLKKQPNTVKHNLSNDLSTDEQDDEKSHVRSRRL
jgi:hypothetical protein